LAGRQTFNVLLRFRQWIRKNILGFYCSVDKAFVGAPMVLVPLDRKEFAWR
jgi:hypothetical protein